jgi:hypothetical protein
LAYSRAAQQQVLKSVVEEAVAVVGQPQASLPQRALVAAEVAQQLELAQAQREAVAARQSREAAVEAEAQPLQARRVSYAQLWLRLPLLPCPLLLFVQPQLPHRQARENVRAPLPLRLLQSSWSAFFSR